jgi:hypothetical protein
VLLAGFKTRRHVSGYAIALFTLLLACHSACGQQTELIELPAPKSDALEKVHHSRFALDRPVIALGLIQAGAELFDGINTRRYVTNPLCKVCTESDPVSRFLLGPRPTWPLMLTYGTAEDLAAAYLHQYMRRSSHRSLRWLSPAAPLTLTAIHVFEGRGLLPLINKSCSSLGPNLRPVPLLDTFTCVPTGPPSAQLPSRSPFLGQPVEPIMVIAGAKLK